MKIKSKYILYILIVVVFLLLSKICYDCYSFKEGMTGSDYANEIDRLGQQFYNTWHNNFWSGGSSPLKIKDLNNWNIDEVKKYFSNSSSFSGSPVRSVIFNMRKAFSENLNMNQQISSYQHDIYDKFTSELYKNQNEITNSLNSLSDQMNQLPSSLRNSLQPSIDTFNKALGPIDAMISSVDNMKKTFSKFVDEKDDYIKKQEEAKRKKQQEEEEAKRKKQQEEEEANRKKQEEEEEAKRKKQQQEEEAKRKQQQEEEEEAKRKKQQEEEEEAKRKQQQEEEEEEEEAKRKKQQEEEEEAKRKQEEQELEPQSENSSNSDTQYNAIMKQLSMLKSNYDEHVSESDTRMNNILTNANNKYQEVVSKLDDLKQTNADTLEEAENIARNAAQKAIKEQQAIQDNMNNQEKQTDENQKQASYDIEKIHNGDFPESNTHAYNNACPSIKTIDKCDDCKPVDEEYVRKDKCRNMYCNVINPHDTNSYIYSCSPVMLDAVNKVNAVCNNCPDKTIVSVPKTDEQKMFEYAQKTRNNMINNYNTRHTLEHNNRDSLEFKNAPNYGTGLALFNSQNPNTLGSFNDYNFNDNSVFPQNATFGPSYTNFITE